MNPSRSWLVALAYIPVAGLIAVLSRDPEVRWHARNGQLLFGAVVAVGVVATLIGIAAPSLSCLYAVGMLIVSAAYLMVAILALVKAVEGQRLIIPGISRHASGRSGD